MFEKTQFSEVLIQWKAACKRIRGGNCKKQDKDGNILSQNIFFIPTSY